MIPWIAWSALRHPLHESVTHTPQVFAGVGTNGASVMPPWLAERTPAPPALTFVLPGKQKVNRVASGGDLPRAVRGLPQVCRVFGDFKVALDLNGEGRVERNLFRIKGHDRHPPTGPA